MHTTITDRNEYIHQWEGASDALVSHDGSSEEVPRNGQPVGEIFSAGF